MVTQSAADAKGLGLNYRSPSTFVISFLGLYTGRIAVLAMRSVVDICGLVLRLTTWHSITNERCEAQLKI